MPGVPRFAFPAPFVTTTSDDWVPWMALNVDAVMRITHITYLPPMRAAGWGRDRHDRLGRRPHRRAETRWSTGPRRRPRWASCAGSRPRRPPTGSLRLHRPRRHPPRRGGGVLRLTQPEAEAKGVRRYPSAAWATRPTRGPRAGARQRRGSWITGQVMPSTAVSCMASEGAAGLARLSPAHTRRIHQLPLDAASAPFAEQATRPPTRRDRHGGGGPRGDALPALRVEGPPLPEASLQPFNDFLGEFAPSWAHADRDLARRGVHARVRRAALRPAHGPAATDRRPAGGGGVRAEILAPVGDGRPCSTAWPVKLAAARQRGDAHPGVDDTDTEFAVRAIISMVTSAAVLGPLLFGSNAAELDRASTSWTMSRMARRHPSAHDAAPGEPISDPADRAPPASRHPSQAGMALVKRPRSWPRCRPPGLGVLGGGVVARGAGPRDRRGPALTDRPFGWTWCSPAGTGRRGARPAGAVGAARRPARWRHAAGRDRRGPRTGAGRRPRRHVLPRRDHRGGRRTGIARLVRRADARAGICVLALCGTPAQAARPRTDRVDAVIASGAEAGAHRSHRPRRRWAVVRHRGRRSPWCGRRRGSTGPRWRRHWCSAGRGGVGRHPLPGHPEAVLHERARASVLAIRGDRHGGHPAFSGKTMRVLANAASPPRGGRGQHRGFLSNCSKATAPPSGACAWATSSGRGAGGPGRRSRPRRAPGWEVVAELVHDAEAALPADSG